MANYSHKMILLLFLLFYSFNSRVHVCNCILPHFYVTNYHYVIVMKKRKDADTVCMCIVYTQKLLPLPPVRCKLEETTGGVYTIGIGVYKTIYQCLYPTCASLPHMSCKLHPMEGSF